MKKLFYAIIVVLLITAVIGAMGYLTNGFKDWTFEQFTKKNDVTENNKTAVAIDVDGNIMYEGEEYVLPSAMTFLSESDGSTQTITATVKPDDATIPYLNWSLAWENPTSTWATDKNVSDYMMHSVSEDTKVITLTCLQAFGESIKVRAEWVNDSTKSAECICEYDRRYEDMRLSLECSDSTVADIHYTSVLEMNRVEFLHLKAYKIEVVGLTGINSYRAGQDNHSSSISVYLSFDKTFYRSNFGEEHISSNESDYRIDLCSSDTLDMAGMELSKSFNWSMAPLDRKSYDPNGVITFPNTMNAFVNYFYNHSDAPFATLCVDITHNSRVKEFRIPVYFNRESLAKNVTSVSVDNSVLVF